MPKTAFRESGLFIKSEKSLKRKDLKFHRLVYFYCLKSGLRTNPI